MNIEPKKDEQGTRLSLRKALKRAPRRIGRLLYHNWPWKLLALFLALCLWAGLITQDPSLTRERVFYDVPVSVTGADSLRRNSGLIVLSGLETDALNVKMRVDVPQREYTNVTASYYNPRIDLTRITSTGEQSLKISTTSSTTYGTVSSVSPDTISVTVDEYVTNYRVPVSINIIGSYPEGFYGAAPSLDPSVVALSGPKSVVDEIVRIYVDFDVSRLAARAGESRTALPMRFVNADGELVESSLLEVTSADVVLRTITVEQVLYPTRMLELSQTSLIEGAPADGYYVKSVGISPASLLAAGDEELLDTVEALFLDNPVDVSGRSESFTTTVRAHKPSELAYVSADTITVAVEIEPIMVSRTFDGINISVRGSAAGQSVSLGQRRISVVITGPQLLLDGLRAANVAAYVDVSDMAAGSYELPALLYLEGIDMNDITYLATPATIPVTISES